MRQTAWLRARWETLGFTIAALARRSGVSRRTLERIGTSAGNGEPYRPSPATVHALAGPLGLSVHAVALLVSGPDVEPAVMDAMLAHAEAGGAVSRAEYDQLRAEVDVLTAELERVRRVVER